MSDAAPDPAEPRSLADRNVDVRDCMKALATTRDFDARRQLYHALLATELAAVVTSPEDDGSPVDPQGGPVTVTPWAGVLEAQQLQPVDELAGLPVFAAFTSERALKRWTKRRADKGEALGPVHAQAVPTATLVDALLERRAATLVLDEGASVRGELFHSELEMLRDGAKRLAAREARRKELEARRRAPSDAPAAPAKPSLWARLTGRAGRQAP